ncbi:GNAT family N-acetyltransferase [Actinoplanes sp. TFC3]|uniref:GNAT family N-acetyltransferase n=1 Tax=Actinoplanes sp. TFC3 TaxID=1710355 RepID=UPI00082F61BB|nr:GNAT family N-acetyltransferase [Actinoplanes sp. TFC3]
MSGFTVVTPAPRSVWEGALAADPDAVVTQSPQWLAGLSRARGYTDASRLYEFEDGTRIVVPLAARAWAGVPVAQESWPYGWGYGGALVAAGRMTDRHAGAMLADLARQPVLRTGVVPMPLASGLWEAGAPRGVHRVPYLTQILDLAGGFPAVWSQRYRTEVRRHVRRAGRVTLDVYRDHRHGLAAFSVLHRLAVDRWARQRGQPLWAARLLARQRNADGELAAAAAALGESCVIWSAYWHGEPVAASVVLHRGRHALGWVSAAHRMLAKETSATYLLSSLAIETACAAGAGYFHLGESDPGSGVEAHKAQFGAEAVRYHALRWERLPLSAGERRLRSAVRRLTCRG